MRTIENEALKRICIKELTISERKYKYVSDRQADNTRVRNINVAKSDVVKKGTNLNNMRLNQFSKFLKKLPFVIIIIMLLISFASLFFLIKKL